MCQIAPSANLFPYYIKDQPWEIICEKGNKNKIKIIIGKDVKLDCLFAKSNLLILFFAWSTFHEQSLSKCN